MADSVIGVILVVSVALGGAGCAERADVGSCGEIHVQGNIVKPYGVTVVDCSLAEDVARRFVDGKRVSVRSGNCWLTGAGEDVVFECGELPEQEQNARFAGSVAHSGDRPARDGAGKISAVVLIKNGRVNLQYQLLLLDERAAIVSDVCLSPDVPETDYCRYISVRERNHE